jgi:outer membrane lipoprotein-sorting protein
MGSPCSFSRRARRGRVAAALLAGPLLALALLIAPLSGPLLAPAPVRAADAVDADALMRRVDELWRGKSSHAQMTMTVKTDRYERSMTMEAWSEGTQKSLVKILAPKKDRGIATLKVERNIWNYLPKINRVTKIPPSMMMGSWMGSHFTNDDLVKESSFADDYTSTITFRGRRGGRAVYEVTSIPRPQAVVVWGKVVMEIEQDTLLPLRAAYYDEDGKVARTLAFEDAKTFDGRRLPARLVLTPADKPGESTTIVYEGIRFDVRLAPDLFTLRGLRES